MAAIHQEIKRRYGRLAREGGSCCGGTAGAGEALSLGCGLPVAGAGLREGEAVLDLGSGAGGDAIEAARAVGPGGSVIGVDLTPEMIARARRSAARAGLRNVRFLAGDIGSLPVPDGSVDIVISNCVVNLAPDKRRVFAEISRVLRPGGRFCIADIVSRGPLPREMRENEALWAGCIGGALEKEAWLDLIRQAGFEDVRVAASAACGSGADGGPVLESVTVEARKPRRPAESAS